MDSNNLFIGHLNRNDVDNLVVFNQSEYPERSQTFIQKIIKFWLDKDPKANESVIVIKDGDTFVGQDFLSPASFYLNKGKNNCWFGFDLIVKEEYRNTGCGIDMLLHIKKNFPYIFGTGANENAYKMHLKMGYLNNGTMRKYLGVSNTFCLPFSIFNNHKSFPSKLIVGKECYDLLSREEMPELNLPYNDDMLEFGREKEYLQWRYFNDLHKYYFYYNKETQNYFVVRIIQKKHINMLLLVDFRCNLSGTNEFGDIIRAVKKLLKKVHLSFFICGSSNRYVDEVCERHHMRSIGTPRLMIGPKFLKEYEERINNREFSLITIADSDGEIYL